MLHSIRRLKMGVSQTDVRETQNFLETQNNDFWIR
jgi:hypothetical protein